MVFLKGKNRIQVSLNLEASVQGNENMGIVGAGCRAPRGEEELGTSPESISPQCQGKSPGTGASRGCGSLEGIQQGLSPAWNSPWSVGPPPSQSGFPAFSFLEISLFYWRRMASLECSTYSLDILKGKGLIWVN